MNRRICIVTNAPISQNPRALKEADALSAAGYEVTVLFVQYGAWTRAMDHAIVRQAAWNAVITQAIGQSSTERLAALSRKIRAKASEWLCRIAMVRPFLTWAYSRFYSAQLSQAIATGADLFIGHNPQSLPVVAAAAEKTNALFAFDAEDFHTGQYPAEEADRIIHRLLRDVEMRYLPNAAYVTGASAGITEALKSRYELKQTATILNVFSSPEHLAGPEPEVTLDRDPGSQRLSLYWYSQIIGADRGLQTLLQALDGLSDHFELHLRGHIDDSVRASLFGLAVDSGFESQLFLHDPVSPDALHHHAAQHDIGLCLESPVILNRDLCTTNKIFLYCQAGLFVLASDTRGQRDIFDKTPEIGALFKADSSEALRTVLVSIADQRTWVDQAKQAATHAARTLWNWERESEKLVTLVSHHMQRETT